MNNAPIGIFDSGLGGLTVARAVIDKLPDEEIIYLGDTEHTPYGPRAIAQVRSLTLSALDELASRGVKALVIACNTATAAALADALAEHLAAARPTRFVFESAPGLPVDPRADHRAWRAALAEEGLPAMSLHSARHTCATLLLEAGVPLRTAQEILGQTQALTTARYQHPSLTAQASALDTVAGAMT